MSAVVLEVADRQVGVLLAARGGYVLMAAIPELDSLDGAAFRSVRAAEAAARARLGAAGPAQRPPANVAG